MRILKRWGSSPSHSLKSNMAAALLPNMVKSPAWIPSRHVQLPVKRMCIRNADDFDGASQFERTGRADPRCHFRMVIPLVSNADKYVLVAEGLAAAAKIDPNLQEGPS